MDSYYRNLYLHEQAVRRELQREIREAWRWVTVLGAVAVILALAIIFK